MIYNYDMFVSQRMCVCVCVTRACHAAEETVGKERPAAVYRRGILYYFSVNYTCNARVKTPSELEKRSRSNYSGRRVSLCTYYYN